MNTLTIKRTKYGVAVQEVYFQAEGCPDAACDLRVDFCIPEQGKYSSCAATLLLNLQPDTAQILDGFRKSYRREIRTGVDPRAFTLSFLREPRPQDIHDFCLAYDQFARQQHLPACNLNKLLFFAGHGSLTISSIRCARSAKVLCQHAFIGNGQRARLLYSVSAFRHYQYDSRQRNRIGKAHRLLHWADMLQFKQAGYDWYDLGGTAAGQTPELQNIDYFKQGFGGELHTEYVNFQPRNMKGWLAMHYLMRKL